MNLKYKLNDKIRKNEQRNWVFATNFNFLIPIFFKPNGVNLWYFKLRLFDLTEFIIWNISGLTTFDCKDIWIIKSELVAKIQLLLASFLGVLAVKWKILKTIYVSMIQLANSNERKLYLISLAFKEKQGFYRFFLYLMFSCLQNIVFKSNLLGDRISNMLHEF